MRPQRMAWSLVLVLGGIPIAVALQRLWLRATVGGGSYFGGDLESYRQGALRLIETGSPYHAALEAGPIDNVIANVPIAYVYPPLLAQLFVPFAAAPEQAVAVAWSSLQIVALAILLPLVYQRYGGTGGGRAVVTIWLIAIASLPLEMAVYGGNVSGWLAIVVAVMLLAYPRGAGVGASTAALLKMTPGVLVVPALMEPRTRLAAASTLGAVATLSFLTATSAWTEWFRLLPNILAFPPGPLEYNLSAAGVLGSVGLAPLGAAIGYVLAATTLLAPVLFVRRGAWAAGVAAASAALLLGPNSLWDHYLAMTAPLALAAWPRAGVGTRLLLVSLLVLHVALWVGPMPVLPRAVGLVVVAASSIAMATQLALAAGTEVMTRARQRTLLVPLRR